MPNDVYYSDVKKMKKSLKIRIKNFFKFFLVVVVFMGCFFVAKYMSTALTVGNLGAYIVYGGTDIKISSTKMYAVTLGSYDDLKEADAVAIGSTIQGASGYVWYDDKYYVIGNIYNNESDANKVIENLKDSKYSTNIKVIEFPKVAISLDCYDSKDMNVINKDIKFIDDVYASLYSYSISFDKGELNNLAISSKLSTLRGELRVLISNTQTLLLSPNSHLQNIQNALLKLDEVVDKAIIKTIDNTATNYSLKNAIAESVRIKYDLYCSLSGD
jgi:hypothetical protein